MQRREDYIGLITHHSAKKTQTGERHVYISLLSMRRVGTIWFGIGNYRASGGKNEDGQHNYQ